MCCIIELMQKNKIKRKYQNNKTIDYLSKNLSHSSSDGKGRYANNY